MRRIEQFDGDDLAAALQVSTLVELCMASALYGLIWQRKPLFYD
jgi:hypothetical protein